MHLTSWISSHLFFHYLGVFFWTSDPSEPLYHHPPVIVDIGAADVNGNNRDAMLQSSFAQFSPSYYGVDIEDTWNVDMVRSSSDEWDIAKESVDIVISTSAFEHDGGFLFLSVPSKAAVHRYPVDNWRFYPDSGNALHKLAMKKGYNVKLLYSKVMAGEEGDCNIIMWKDSASRDENSLIVSESLISHIERFVDGFEFSVLLNIDRIEKMSGNTPLPSDILPELTADAESKGFLTAFTEESILTIKNLFLCPVYCRHDNNTMSFIQPLENLQEEYVNYQLHLSGECVRDIVFVALKRDLVGNNRVAIAADFKKFSLRLGHYMDLEEAIGLIDYTFSEFWRQQQPQQ